MRRILIVCLMTALLCPLSACGGEGGRDADALALEVRGAYLSMEGCTAELELTADYGQRVYTYGMKVDWTREGETVLTLTAPEDVAGLRAHIAQGESALEYDGVWVETGPLNPDGLSPMDAPVALLTALREGYLASTGLETVGEEEQLHLVVREPDAQPGTGTEIALWCDPVSGALLRGEIAQDGVTVITCIFQSFVMEGLTENS